MGTVVILMVTPSFDHHGELRWMSRATGTDKSMEEAWEDGVKVSPVGYSFDEARYYPPEDVVIGHNEYSYDTVLFAENIKMHSDELMECVYCGKEFKSQKECPRCGRSEWRLAEWNG